MMRKAINQFPYGEAHMHIFMNGTDYKKAVADQKNGVCDRVIHAHLAEYRKRGITWLREGGDIYGTSKRTMELAPAYGITYRTPIFAIHKKGHYGAIVGRGYETMQEYRKLIGDLRRQGGHFVKIMISGIMDFTHGGLTEPSLADSEIHELIHIAHEEGFPVMAHTNGSQAVRAAALAGVDSIEHGNFCDEDALQALAASDAVWVPTIVTVKNLLGDGRFPEQDLVPLYKISDEMGMEFATASLHNSFYFVEAKNIIHDRPMVAKNFENLVNELLRSNSPKKWFRAYFNHGLINYIYGQKRLLPCDMSFDTFFIDPYGDVMPCNGTKDKEVMGNLNNQTWDELWNSPEAEKVRAKVRCCDRDCWMIGSVSPAMHKYIWKPATWVLVHKFKALFTKHPYSMYELKICRDYRDGKVTKEELDKCSTCDMNCVINNGLSEASKEQLKHKTGEEIVDADIAQQMETK
jgi:hypothetical protein